MSVVVIDIVLSLQEQRLTDDALAEFATMYATEATQKARSMTRTDSLAMKGANFVYRLPVMKDWDDYPESLAAIRRKLTSASLVNDQNFQYIVWSENHQIKLEALELKHDLDLGSEALDIQKIQQTELENFLSKDDILFEHAGSALFELPSDQQSDYFLRVGNLQSSQSYFSAVFFWLIPDLQDIQHIFCDTWSISTTAAVVAEYLMTYRQFGSAKKDERVTWSFSPSYIPRSAIHTQLIYDALNTAREKEGKVLFLSSFYSSGKLEQTISDQVFYFDGTEEVVLAAIYAVGKDRFEFTTNILCDVQKVLAKRGLVGKSAKVQPESEMLKVSRVSFFPDYRSVEIRPFLRIDILKDSKFIDRYVGGNIFSVHRDGRNSAHRVSGSPRHHAFHVDLPTMFSHKNFAVSLSEALKGLTNFDVILLDKSPGAKALLQAIGSHSSSLISKAKIFEIEDWRQLRGSSLCLDAINASTNRTLVLVPTIITGQTIGDIKRHLRETSIHSLSRVHYLVGLLRPPDAETIRNYTELADVYVGESSLSVVETVTVPNWGRKQCPWCIEQDIIENASTKEELDQKTRDRFGQRHQELQSGGSEGLKGPEVFFTDDPGERLPFYTGSLFVDTLKTNPDALDELHEIGGLESSNRLQEIASQTPVSEADLCFVVANAIQNWRLRIGGKNVRKITVDAATVSNDDKYNEARLRAAIWRSLRPDERALAVRASADFSHLFNRVFSDSKESNHRCLELEALIGFGSEVTRQAGGDLQNWNWQPTKWLAKP